MEILQTVNEKDDSDLHIQFIKSQLAALDLTLDEAVRGRQLEHKERRVLWARRMRKCMTGGHVDRHGGKKECSDDEPKPVKTRVMGLSEKQMLLLEEIESESLSSPGGGPIELSPRKIQKRERLRVRDLQRRREANAERHGWLVKLESPGDINIPRRELAKSLESPLTMSDLTIETSALNTVPSVTSDHTLPNIPQKSFAVDNLNMPQGEEEGVSERNLSQPWLWG